MSTSASLCALVVVTATSVAGLSAQRPPLDKVNLPDGFSIQVYAVGLTNPAGEAVGFGELGGAMSVSSHFRGSGLSPSLVEHEPHHLDAIVQGEDDRCARQLDLEGVCVSPSRHADPLLARCLQQEFRVAPRHFQVDTKGHLVRPDIV